MKILVSGRTIEEGVFRLIDTKTYKSKLVSRVQAEQLHKQKGIEFMDLYKWWFSPENKRELPF